MDAPDPVQCMQAVLRAVGMVEDPEMQRTAERYVEFLRDFHTPTPPPELSVLPTKGRDPVVLRDVPFYSLCAHHLLPFHGHVTVAYWPHGSLAGLGSIGRCISHFASRPQLQERVGSDLASYLHAALQPRVLGVRIIARHFCMEMRGMKNQGQVETLATRGWDAELSPRLEALMRQ